MGADAGVGRPAGCDLSAAGALWAGLGRSGAAAGRDLAGACSGDSTTATANERSGAFAARHALAGVRAGLRVRHSVVCRGLLLGLRHHAPLWRDADSGRRAGDDLVLHVCRALSRDVRTAAGFGRGIEQLWTEGRRIGSVDAARACGRSVSLGCGGTRTDADYRVSMGTSGILADREFCAHADCDPHRRVRTLI